LKAFTEISSKDNKYIKYVAKLQKSSKFRSEENSFVLEGLRICKDAMENNIDFRLLFLSESFCDKFSDEADNFSANALSVFVVKDYLFEKMGDTENPQGIIAVADIKGLDNCPLQKGRYVALEDIQDPSNLGAISRTCEALGVAGIIVTKNTCDPYSPKSLRASMGTLLRMPIYITDDITSFLKDNNLRGFACVVDSFATSIADVSFDDGDVIIIGNEANGITDKTKENSYKRITIKMKGRAESLNAAAAAAIAVYELTK